LEIAMKAALAESPIMEEAFRIDDTIKEIHKRRNQDAVKIADLLLEMKERDLFAALGYASVAAYAAKELGYSESKTRDLLALAFNLRDLPQLRAAAERGELPWTKLRTAAAIASKSDEDEWLAVARGCSSEALERAAAEARGEEVSIRKVLKLSPAEDADIEEAVTALRAEGFEGSLGALIAEACRRAVVGEKTGGERYRIVITKCDECSKATREVAAGSIAVAQPVIEQRLCDAEVLDLKEGAQAPVKRTMPARVARFVDARDKGRCRVPGCRNRAFVERHHEGGFRFVGHDPRKIVLLCSAHHAARHTGHLRIEFRGDEVRFSLRDGTVLEGDPESTRLASYEADRGRGTNEETARTCLG
jgi:hypothetical protein